LPPVCFGQRAHASAGGSRVRLAGQNCAFVRSRWISRSIHARSLPHCGRLGLLGPSGIGGVPVLRKAFLSERGAGHSVAALAIRRGGPFCRRPGRPSTVSWLYPRLAGGREFLIKLYSFYLMVNRSRAHQCIAEQDCPLQPNEERPKPSAASQSLYCGLEQYGCQLMVRALLQSRQAIKGWALLQSRKRLRWWALLQSRWRSSRDWARNSSDVLIIGADLKDGPAAGFRVVQEARVSYPIFVFNRAAQFSRAGRGRGKGFG